MQRKRWKSVKKGVWGLMILTLLLTIQGCANSSSSSTNILLTASKNASLTLTSSSFQENGQIPKKYWHQQENTSISLAWTQAPNQTKSFAVFMVDLNPVADQWVHWAVTNIPPEVRKLPEGASGTKQMPQGSQELNNSFGTPGYGGPQPPAGSGNHRYVIWLCALDTPTLDTPDSISFQTFKKLVKPHLLATAKLTGFAEASGG